ncbi:hypothetical protein FHG87_005093 [Trinorchestia longiramus]|nr:hypothetical protein FHG87_005093 [Trinorchestia longiramus]
MHLIAVLVEYDDVSWQRREWVSVYQRGAFQVFLLEHTLVYAPRAAGGAALHRQQRTPAHQLHPALKFVLLIDNVGLGDYKLQPVEYLTDRAIEHLDPETLLHHQEGSACISACRGEAEAEAAVRAWLAEQDGQRILVDTPSVLVGFRVQVYRAEGTTQWYTAVIVNYNDTTKELTVTDDTVLEEHSEDPCLLQIRLLGEGVVESILRGENVGITSRRSRSHTALQQSAGRQIRRDAASRQKKTSASRPHASPTSSHSSPPPSIGIKVSNSNDKLTTNVILPVTRVQSTEINRVVNLKSNININPKVSLSADLKIENYANIKNNNNNNNSNNKNNNRSPKRITENHKRHFSSSRNYNNNNKARSMPPTISEDASPATPPAEVSSNGPIEDSSASSDNSSDCPNYPDSPSVGLTTDESVVTLADNPLPTPPAEAAPGTGSSSLVPSPVSTYPSKQGDAVSSSERDCGDEDARFDALCSGRIVAHTPSVKKDSPSLSLKRDSPVVDVQDTRCTSNQSPKTKPLVNLESASDKFSDVDVLKNSTEDMLLKGNIKYNNNAIDNDSLSSNEDVVYLRSSMPINSLNNPKISPKPKLTIPPSNSIHRQSVGSVPVVSPTTGSSLTKPHHSISDDECKNTPPSSSCSTGDSEARYRHVNSPSSKHSSRNHSSSSPRTPPTCYGSRSSSPSRPCRDKERQPTTVPLSNPRLDNSGQ